MSSLFTKIINREIPAHIIYEDDRTIAFLDINPVQPGHTLVVPKQEVDALQGLHDDDYLALMSVVKSLMVRLGSRLDTERVGLKVEGFDVPHAHVHLIPCNTPEEFNSSPVAAESDALKRLAEQLQA